MPGSTVRSRRLAQILREKRKAAGISKAEAASLASHSLMWIYRVEKPETCRPHPNDVRRLLQIYGVTDPAETERAAALAAEARRNGWWHEYDLPAATATYVGLEAEAAAKKTWECTFIPGLLQTEDYARAVITSGLDDLDSGKIGELVRARMERQKILHRPGPLALHNVIGEQVLHRVIGGPAVMRAQLLHVAGAAQAENVTVQVLPFAAGAHPGMTGAFTILSYPDPDDHDIVYVDTAVGPVYAEEPPDIGRAHRAFSRLAAAALPPHDSIELIAKAARTL
jgi:hypothetical protein